MPLLDLYTIAIDEYRFQVDLNWKRTQYFLAFNVALVAISTGLAIDDGTQSQAIAIGLYAAGAVSAILCLLAHRTQHSYYRAARDRMVRIGERLQLGDDAVRTTPGSGSSADRPGSVTFFTATVLVTLAVLDVVGIIAAVVTLTS